MRKMMSAAALSLLWTSGAFAQQAFYWPAPASPSGSRYYLPMGTPLMLRTRTEVNTKQMKPGDRFYLEVAESVTFRGQIVVPVGSPAMAEVVRSERNGYFGKRGTIEVELVQVETPYGPVRLTGRTSQNGKDAGVWAIGGAALVAWPLAFIHGTSGYIRHGTVVNGYLAEPLAFDQAATNIAGTAVQPDARAVPAALASNPSSDVRPGFSNR